MTIFKIFSISIYIFVLKVENSDSTHPDYFLNITETINKYGYPAETHKVITGDGYILELFRIPHSKGGSVTNKKTILLMHGLFGQAENFVMAGMYNASLAYHLADAGFDVWLGNTRGNQHGRRHIRLNPRYRSFWNFSWHEIGMYDLPAIIDCILENTKMRKLHYVGHSQGGSIFLIMNSMKPEYQKKIVSSSLLAPAAYMGHAGNIWATPLVSSLRFLENVTGILYEFPPHSIQFSQMFSSFCNTFQEICARTYSFLAGYDSKEVRTKEILPVALKYIPTVSSRQPLHFGQTAESGHFRPWDYGKDQNLITYGTAEPPDYPIENIKVPIAIYYTLGDNLVNYKDIDELSKKLPNCVRKHLIPDPKFTHFDFVLSSNKKMLIYPILEFLKTYDNDLRNS